MEQKSDIERVWDKERGRENKMESERDPHNLEGEASMDHLIGDELLWHSMTFDVILI